MIEVWSVSTGPVQLRSNFSVTCVCMCVCGWKVLLTGSICSGLMFCPLRSIISNFIFKIHCMNVLTSHFDHCMFLETFFKSTFFCTIHMLPREAHFIWKRQILKPAGKWGELFRKLKVGLLVFNASVWRTLNSNWKGHLQVRDTSGPFYICVPFYFQNKINSFETISFPYAFLFFFLAFLIQDKCVSGNWIIPQPFS